jgi:hypothetical protein
MRLKYMLRRAGVGGRDVRSHLDGRLALGWILLVSGCFDFDSLGRGNGALVATRIFVNSPTIDGQLDDWPSGFPYEVSSATSNLSSMTFTGTPSVDNADSSATVAIRWDDNYLYVAARIRDNARGAYLTSSNIYEDDSIEVFIDGNGDRRGPYGQDDLQCIFRADGTAQLLRQQRQQAGQFCGTFAVRQGVGADWMLEVAFPWSLLGSTSPSGGRLLGFDIVLNDDDNAAAQEQKHYLIWRDATPEACPPLCQPDLLCRPSCSTFTFAELRLSNR